MHLKAQRINRSVALFLGIAFSVLSCHALADTGVQEAKFITDLKALADKGDAQAEYTLGNSYYVGVGVTRNYSESVKWFTKAAEQGNAKAESALGNMYYNGFGITKNISEAIKWWTKAAEHHDSDAQDQLGFVYLLGDGVPKDNVKAYMWFNIAAANHDAHATQDRDNVAKLMMAEQIAEAQRLQNEWTRSHQ